MKRFSVYQQWQHHHSISHFDTAIEVEDMIGKFIGKPNESAWTIHPSSAMALNLLADNETTTYEVRGPSIGISNKTQWVATFVVQRNSITRHNYATTPLEGNQVIIQTPEGDFYSAVVKNGVFAVQKNLQYPSVYTFDYVRNWWTMEEFKIYQQSYQLLSTLTPGGSEYANDPERMVEHIRDTEHTQHRQIIKLTKEKKALEELLQFSKLADYMPNTDMPFNEAVVFAINYMVETINRYENPYKGFTFDEELG